MVSLDRSLSAKSSKWEDSLFSQLFNQLEKVPPLKLRRPDGLCWFTKFVGESAIDDGGIFRESVSNICAGM